MKCTTQFWAEQKVTRTMCKCTAVWKERSLTEPSASQVADRVAGSAVTNLFLAMGDMQGMERRWQLPVLIMANEAQASPSYSVWIFVVMGESGAVFLDQELPSVGEKEKCNTMAQC
ncbi:hypothetical protein NQZ68_003355 [Dissostichus eleginoides]|nr:hypothetical protein NQZ68_003355 [Dissostichus eleginoides]